MIITAVELLDAYVLYVAGAVGLFGLIALASWLRARRSYRRAAFGLVREVAAAAVTRSLLLLILAGFLGALLFINSAYVAPNIPTIFDIEPTPTATIPVTPEPTATSPVVIPGLTTPTLEATFTPLPSSTPVPLGGSGCSNPNATITSPLPGAVIGGEFEVLGTADIDNFGFYVLEISTLGDNWLTVFTGTVPVRNGVLGVWNANLQAPGDYAFRLAVLDANGSGPPPCTIPISISSN